MFYFILFILVISQIYTLISVISLSKVKKRSAEVIERYKGITTLEKIPERIYYKDVEPDWNTFYNFMENIKLENWKAEVTEDSHHISRDSCWVVSLISHDQSSSMSIRIRDYGDGVFLASCNIRAGGASLSVDKEDKIATDIILFAWNYVVEYYKNQNIEIINSYQFAIDRINTQLKTLNRTKRLNNILEL
jgi:hypothetical protein